MIDVLPVEAMRNSDAATIAGGVSGRELMRRAGEGLFRAFPWKAKTAVVCGKGNNAGDGYVLSTLLTDAGIACELFLPEVPRAEAPDQGLFSPDGRYWFDRCREREIPVHGWGEVDSFAGYACIADCIFGTGFHGTIRGEAARIVRLINGSGAAVVSADINSGLNGDNGLAEEAVISDLTVSIGSFQPGHFLNKAKDLMKDKVNCDIGIAPVGRALQLVEAADVAALFPPRKNFSNKGTYGTLALIGGSLPYPGAIRLAEASNAAMRAGAGVVRAAVPRSLCPAMIPLILESTLFPLSDRDGGLVFRPEEFERLLQHVRVAAFGMGIGNTDQTREALRYLLRNTPGPLIIDADGLNALAALLQEEPEMLKEAACPVVLTPHPGEFSRLCGKSIPEIQADSIALAEAFAARHGVILLLKGPATIVTDGKNTLLVDRGCPGMATAGSGDVLSGILAAVCAGQPDLLKAVAGGAWLNGAAGELAQSRVGAVSMTASDTVRALPDIIHKILTIQSGIH